MMRKLTDTDMENILGSIVSGYRVENVRVKRGNCTDSDHYGILLGKSDDGHYVTWQFHLDEDEKVNPYWGHYFMEYSDAALKDYNDRDLELQSFKVVITEKLEKVVTVDAVSRGKAEQIVSDGWHNGKYVLGADDFTGVVEFVVVPADE